MEKSKCKQKFSLLTRHVFILWAFMGFVIMYVLNVNLSMAIISMVNHSAIHVKINVTPECHMAKSNDTKQVDGKFIWDEKTQGIILGAFFWGYLILQIPGGWLAKRIGGKWVYGFGIFGTSVLALVIPIATELHYGWLIAIRIFQGFFESVTAPALHSMLGLWSPPKEITFMSGFAYSGTQMGTVIGLIISGFLIDNQVMGGWPSAFYVPGIFGTAWFICWCFVGYSSPKDHPRISEEEKEYIERSINLSNKEDMHNIPWKAIFLSLPVWATSVAFFCTTWYFCLTITSVSGYFKTVVGFTISEGGFVAALPHLLTFICRIIVSKVADVVKFQGLLSTTVTRKVFNTIGITGMTITIILISYVGCNQILIVSIFCFGAVFFSFTVAGFYNNHLDLSPVHAGILIGISNTIANICGIIAPYIVGVVTQDNQTKEQWKIIFFISAAITFAGAIFYLIFGSGERQPWVDQKSQQI